MTRRGLYDNLAGDEQGGSVTRTPASPLRDRIAFVTGATGGIGAASAAALARDGAQVVLADLDADAGGRLVEQLGGAAHATFLRVDVTDPASVDGAVDEVVRRFGRLDIAHNNAGVQFAETLLADTPLEQWDRIIATNLSGVFYSMRAEIVAMRAAGGGSIVNTGSVLSVRAMKLHGAYTAAKHGVIGLTKAAALEYSADGIRVNAVLPGVIDTPMVAHLAATLPGYLEEVTSGHPIGRIGTPAEIAEAVVWLASDAASFVTGASLEADGGFLVA
ncbi:glucose 1-dehydrogenase [Schumannella soli]|uniref:Glucose 1-dehydrogenase n=1 Tax=Schumannella soli TaxID=2590779 RepID=A0A506XX61_9MICO|nr:glucose 1-dehydrogenase [Schumannella soli]